MVTAVAINAEGIESVEVVNFEMLSDTQDRQAMRYTSLSVKGSGMKI